MATYQIKNDDITIKKSDVGTPVKVSCQVKFIRDDEKESDYQYYEIDAIRDATEEEQETAICSALQVAANEFNTRLYA